MKILNKLNHIKMNDENPFYQISLNSNYFEPYLKKLITISIF